MELLELQQANIYTISQSFGLGLNGMLNREFRAELAELFLDTPLLLQKLKLLNKTIRQTNQNEHWQRMHTNLEIIFGASKNAMA